ncbi:DUF6153 family protein [Saccharomonospora cyanea]|uniref:Uncharacterized protein n=1 Tax=Saccharomonospora cyanea NA-134 TaxID=882082 RepID=H5XDL1_9PSEU|nr:DUF6153 family protein [Saccharomonospora cyanea]EHR61332.1 hypothetical protein SaccyDRAFT_2460 [Saccharomonospora cyanea NA-134]
MTDPRRRGAILRWLLVCSVLLGLVIMHHVVNQHIEHGDPSATVQQVTTEHDTAGHDDSSAPSHEGSSVLAHLCFAVLVGSIVLLITVRLIRRFRDTVTRPRPLADRTGGGRAPPSPLPTPDGFAYDLCVLRL